MAFHVDESKLRSALPPPVSLPSEDWYVAKRVLGVLALLVITAGLAVYSLLELFGGR
jgi:hypothetical protein